MVCRDLWSMTSTCKSWGRILRGWWRQVVQLWGQCALKQKTKKSGSKANNDSGASGVKTVMWLLA